MMEFAHSYRYKYSKVKSSRYLGVSYFVISATNLKTGKVGYFAMSKCETLVDGYRCRTIDAAERKIRASIRYWLKQEHTLAAA